MSRTATELARSTKSSPRQLGERRSHETSPSGGLAKTFIFKIFDEKRLKETTNSQHPFCPNVLLIHLR